ncbi:hypothetical protein ACA910_021027 [Epithemia clementina (nom. ined.)]
MKLSAVAFFYLFSFTTAQSQLRNLNSHRSVAALSAVEEQHQEALPSKAGQDENELQEITGSDERILSMDQKVVIEGASFRTNALDQQTVANGSIERKAAGMAPVGKQPAAKAAGQKATQPTGTKQPNNKDNTTKTTGGGNTSSSSSSSSTYVAKTSVLDSALCKCQAFKDTQTGIWHTGDCTCNPNNSQRDGNGHVIFKCQNSKSGVSVTQDGRMYYYCPDGRRYLRS